MTRTFEITADCACPMRLDKYIASKSSYRGAPPTRSALKSRGSKAYINGKAAKLSSAVHEKDIVRVEWEEAAAADIQGQDIPLDIIYEDSNVTVVNKPQGMVTHPAAGNWSGTLVNALLGYYARSGGDDGDGNGNSDGDSDGNANSNSGVDYSSDGDSNSGVDGGSNGEKRNPPLFSAVNTHSQLRPGIVHRLDKDTSGAIITAKNEKTLVYLQSQFAARTVRKEYIAITRGRPKYVCGVIDCRIVRCKHDRKKFTATEDNTLGRAAKTLYHCISCYGPYSVMRLRLKTGRTHQIRVHLKHIGCPILGDSIYYTRSGKPRRDDLFPDAALMLHSRLIELRLPNSTKRTLFVAPVPKRFIDVLKVLKGKYTRETLKEKMACGNQNEHKRVQ